MHVTGMTSSEQAPKFAASSVGHSGTADPWRVRPFVSQQTDIVAHDREIIFQESDYYNTPHAFNFLGTASRGIVLT